MQSNNDAPAFGEADQSSPKSKGVNIAAAGYAIPDDQPQPPKDRAPYNPELLEQLHQASQ